MEQIEMLWQYQQADIAADRFENKMRRSPNRIKLIKSRDFILEQQNAIKSIEEEVLSMADRVDILKEAVNRTKEQLQGMEEKFEHEAHTSLEEAKTFTHDAKKLLRTINDYEQEISQIGTLAKDKDLQQKEIRVKAAKVKIEFDETKALYDAERKEQSVQLEKMRALAEDKAKEIDPTLLKKYQGIKSHVSPPMAQLLNDQCGGCNMSLPSATLRAIKTDHAIIECENCGRMLVQ